MKKIPTMTDKWIIVKLTKHRNAIGKERDKLRSMQDDVEALLGSCERGLEALDEAIQIFSEHA